MHCIKCGGDIGKDDKFCQNCGVSLTSKEETNPEKISGFFINKKFLLISISVIIFLFITISSIIYIKKANEKKIEKSSKEQMQEAVLIEKKLQDDKLKDLEIMLATAYNIDEFIILETDKEYYNRLLKELEQAIKNKEINKGKEILKEIENLKITFQTKSKETIESRIAKLKSLNMSLAFDIERLIIQEYTQDTERLLLAEKYVTANNIINQWEMMSTLIQAENDKELLISQIDVMGYPKVKLYLQIRNLVTGEKISINHFDKFSIIEGIGNDYIEKPILAAMQLKEKERLNINLLADISGSMANELNSVKQVMKNFLNQIQFNVGDQASLITFDNNVSIAIDFTSTKNTIINEIDQMQVGNMTALYDALYVAISNTSMQEGAKCVIAFTDGLDNYSSKAVSEVISLAKTYKIPVYIVGIGQNVDSSTLSYLSESTNGFYRNINSGVSMESIYNEIYREQKELYLLEYETDQKAEDLKERKIYVTYQDDNMDMRNVANFIPKELMKEPEDYKELVNKSTISNSEIENEILRIRAIWNADRKAMENKQYKVSKWANGKTAYSDNGQIKMIEIQKNIDGINYSRTYNYENGKLIFAYIESSDAHRLYFKNDNLFRWRYTVDANKRDNAINHDNQGDSEEFNKWGNFALDEGYKVYSEANNNL